ncbi:methyl-accepting chemotaxis protein, partial [Curvivirga aplysinae]|uniref:methyl-accepting chemotaxis protein n=1 Tax=Curvivirga aplysinae TaxID=2529852 RepID=UPI0012BBBC07
RISLNKLIPATTIFLSLLTAIVIGSAGYFLASDALSKQAEEKLSAQVFSKAETIDLLMTRLKEDILLLAATPSTNTSFGEFETGWLMTKGEKTEVFQDVFITNNPNSPDARAEFIDPKGFKSSYRKAHKKHHLFYKRFAQEKGLNELYLMDKEGNVVYSVNKNIDFATNLMSGPFKNSGLGQVFKQALKINDPSQIAFSDFTAYSALDDKPTSFIAAPILSKKGRFVGAVAFQLPETVINQVMNQSEGMGETGEAYLVGPDMKMRSNSRFSDEYMIAIESKENQAVADALAGESGVLHYTGDDGVDYLSAFTPITIEGVTWAVVAELHEDEAVASAIKLGQFMLYLMLGMVVFATVTGLFLGRNIAGPMLKLVESMQELAKDAKNATVPDLDPQTAFGKIAEILSDFKERIIKSEQNAEERILEQETNLRKAEQLHNLVQRFEENINKSLTAVQGASDHMRGTAENMQGTVENTSNLAGDVTLVTDSASQNVGSVAAATEELVNTIQEISGQVAHSSSISDHAAEETQKGLELVNSLNESTHKIGEVITMINDISEQTNLLALNATIEAARAGEAGKGFSVVANEVKSLASQTAKATDEVSDHINKIRTDTQDTVVAINQINDIISNLSEIGTAVAAAVEEQGATTQEIARNTQEAASGTEDLRNKIGDVNQMTDTSKESMDTMLEATTELLSLSEGIRHDIEGFLKDVKTIN